MRLSCDLLLNTQHFLENFDVLLESARDLLVLLQLVREENLDTSKRLQLSFFVLFLSSSGLLAGSLLLAPEQYLLLFILHVQA